MKYLSIIFILIFSISAHAATFTVTRSDNRNSTCNSGVDCSLREAVKAANAVSSHDVINFSGLSLITLTSEIVITNNGFLAINGGGANTLTIDAGSGTNRIFYITGFATITGVTLAGGTASAGGAILTSGGSLKLDGVHVTGSSASLNGGGVLLSGGSHQIINSTISNNSATSCGGVFNNLGYLTVTNSTISGNRTSELGAGLCNQGSTTILRNVTVTNNTALAGGGLYQTGGGGDFIIGNTIVAGNIATNGISQEIIYGTGTFTSEGNNLVGDETGDARNGDAINGNSIVYQPSDILDTNPLLGILQNNGGTTPTHALLPGSPAINAGNNGNTILNNDQRGFLRFVGGIVDIGAYESDMPQTPTCTFLITPNSQDFPASGGTGTISVSGQAGCAYSSLNESTFVTLNSGAEGTGNGTVNFTVAPNSGTARSVTLFVAGQNFTVNQAGVKSRKRVRFF